MAFYLDAGLKRMEHGSVTPEVASSSLIVRINFKVLYYLK